MTKSLLSEVKISTKRIREEIPTWETRNKLHWLYKVTLSHNGKTETFKFWGSVNDWQRDLDPDYKEALSCILSDAQAYSDSRDIDDFADEFGYTKPSQAIRAYEGCKREFEQLNRLGFDQMDIIQLSQEVEEK